MAIRGNPIWLVVARLTFPLRWKILSRKMWTLKRMVESLTDCFSQGSDQRIDGRTWGTYNVYVRSTFDGCFACLTKADETTVPRGGMLWVSYMHDPHQIEKLVLNSISAFSGWSPFHYFTSLVRRMRMRTREGLIIISDGDDITPLAEKRGERELVKLFSVNQVLGGIFVPLIMRKVPRRKVLFCRVTHLVLWNLQLT